MGSYTIAGPYFEWWDVLNTYPFGSLWQISVKNDKRLQGSGVEAALNSKRRE